jgi:hypothetical protein
MYEDADRLVEGVVGSPRSEVRSLTDSDSSFAPHFEWQEALSRISRSSSVSTSTYSEEMSPKVEDDAQTHSILPESLRDWYAPIRCEDASQK